MPCAQNPNCSDPRSDLTVSLPTDLIVKMQQHADESGNTIDQVVEAAFSAIKGRICLAKRIK